MQINILHKALNQIGLEQKEIDIYLYLLINDDKSIKSIAKAVELSRVAVYKYLKILSNRGLIEHKKDFTTPIILANPNKIISILRENEHKNAIFAKELTDLMPDLISRINLNNTNKLFRHLKGQSQIMYLLDEILEEAQCPDEFLTINEGEDFNQMVSADYIKGWIERRVEKRIPIKTIIQGNNSLMLKEMQNNEIDLRTVKISPIISMPVSGCVTIVKNKVIIWDTVLYEAIVIENYTTSNLFRGIFETFWKLLN